MTSGLEKPFWTDSHCHLAMADFDLDRQGAIERAKAAGVGRLVSVATNPDDWESAAALAADGAMIATAGLHPHEASRWNDKVQSALAKALGHPKVRAVGEIGLDFHYDLSPRNIQREIFAAQLTMAAKRRLPVIIHSRQALEETLETLRSEGRGVSGVVHCFTYGPEAVRPFLDLGLYISISGIVTFPKAGELREAAKLVPGDRLLVETDSPYLAPVPFRGKRCEPAHVARTGAFLAPLLPLSTEELARATSENAARLFAWP